MNTKNSKQIKDYLEQTLLVDKKVRLKNKQIQDLQSLSEALQGNKKNNAVMQIERLQNEYIEEVVALLMLKYQVSELIKTVDNENVKLVLEARYIACLKWDEMAELLYFSVVHVQRLAKKGYEMLSFSDFMI